MITLVSATVVTGLACLFMLVTRSRGSRKAGRRAYRIVQIVTALVLVATLVSAWFGFGIGSFLKNYMNVSTYIDETYVDPGSVKVTFPEKKRNLIFIYLESMEVTYMDGASGGAFPENVIPELTKFANENEDFRGSSDTVNGGIALPGAVWTMGAVFGTTSGLPLKTPLGQNGTKTSPWLGSTSRHRASTTSTSTGRNSPLMSGSTQAPQNMTLSSLTMYTT